MRPRTGRSPDSHLFRKRRPGAPADYYRVEAAGLDWLRRPDGPPVPGVLTVATDHLDIERLPPGAATTESSADFGRRLARLHATGARGYGAPPDGVSADHGYIADLPLPFGDWDSFGPFYAEARVEPYLRMLVDCGEMSATGPVAATFRSLLDALADGSSAVAGPGEPASRIHGDLWSGNVLWAPAPGGGAVTGWLIDPAAHGGHRETDLAMLALFGLPGLAVVLAAYDEVAPLADGWRDRVALHQVHPLLVHAVLFGGGYLSQAHAAARAGLRLT